MNTLCNKLAKKYGLPLSSVVGILVNLSSQKDWKSNITQTIQFLKGKQLTGMYSNKQLVTCQRIKQGEDPLTIWGKLSFKYRNFYLSILNPEDINPICIDTHMINFYLDRYPSSKLHKLEKVKVFSSKKWYTRIQDEIRKEAKILDLVPSHCQAIIWAQQRNGTNF